MEIKLGKIKKAEWGRLYDRNFMYGLHLTFEGAGWLVASPSHLLNMHPDCKWSKEEKLNALFELNEFVYKTLGEAKVDTVDQLKNIPVEVTFDGMIFKSFRILAEVL